jgi:hypothetical protein
MTTLIVSLGYALSKFVVRTRLAFLKTWGGLNVLGSTCLDSSGCDRFNSAEAKLEIAAKQLVKREVDLILGSSQVTQVYTRNWKGAEEIVGLGGS